MRFLTFCGKLEFEMGSNFLNVRQFAIFILQLSDENLITVKEISDFVTGRKTCGIQSAPILRSQINDRERVRIGCGIFSFVLSSFRKLRQNDIHFLSQSFHQRN